jgi:hypothetical protein
MAEYDVINSLLNDSSPMAAKDITAPQLSPGSNDFGRGLKLDGDR